MVAPNKGLSANAQDRQSAKAEVLKAYASTVHPVSGKEVQIVFDSERECVVPKDVLKCLAACELLSNILGEDVVTLQETLPNYKDLSGVDWEFINIKLLKPAEALRYLAERYPTATYFRFVQYHRQFALINPYYDAVDLTGFICFER